MNDKWEESNEQLNNDITKKIMKMGFKNATTATFVPNISYFRQQIKECPNCSKGLTCETHKIKRRTDKGNVYKGKKVDRSDLRINAPIEEAFHIDNALDFNKGNI